MCEHQIGSWVLPHIFGSGQFGSKSTRIAPGVLDFYKNGVREETVSHFSLDSHTDHPRQYTRTVRFSWIEFMLEVLPLLWSFTSLKRLKFCWKFGHYCGVFFQSKRLSFVVVVPLLWKFYCIIHWRNLVKSMPAQDKIPRNRVWSRRILEKWEHLFIYFTLDVYYLRGT
jgi:hypothetical protein